jgi:hypothetical protein
MPNIKVVDCVLSFSTTPRSSKLEKPSKDMLQILYNIEKSILEPKKLKKIKKFEKIEKSEKIEKLKKRFDFLPIFEFEQVSKISKKSIILPDFLSG